MRAHTNFLRNDSDLSPKDIETLHIIDHQLSTIFSVRHTPDFVDKIEKEIQRQIKSDPALRFELKEDKLTTKKEAKNIKSTLFGISDSIHELKKTLFSEGINIYIASKKEEGKELKSPVLFAKEFAMERIYIGNCMPDISEKIISPLHEAIEKYNNPELKRYSKKQVFEKDILSLINNNTTKIVEKLNASIERLEEYASNDVELLIKLTSSEAIEKFREHYAEYVQLTHRHKDVSKILPY